MTLIICPACDTRYEIAAVLPSEGRKVRCSKCGHIWQAISVTLGTDRAAEAPEAARVPQMTSAPQPPPAPPSPQMSQEVRPAPGAVNPAMRAFAGIARAPQAPEEEANHGDRTPAPPPPAPPPVDAELDGGDDFEADFDGFGGDVPAAAPNGPEPGLPAIVAAKQMPVFGDLQFGALNDAATAPEASNIVIGGQKHRPRPAVAVGWTLLALVVILLGGVFVLAPLSVVSVLPGAARLYGMLGMPVSARGLAFEGIHYEWSNTSGETVLKVAGNVVNVTASPMAAPTVVIALRDAAGNEISEWTANLGVPGLAGGQHFSFEAEIPSPPDNVSSLKVRFASKAK